MVARQLQLRRGSAIEHGQFRGAVAELSVIADEWRLVVHDGVTLGGHKVARFDEITPVGTALLKANNLADLPALNIGREVLGVSSARVRVATTENINLDTGLVYGAFIDGIMLQVGDLVLVKSQTDPAENGIREVGTSPPSARVEPWAEFDDYPGLWVSIEEGIMNGGVPHLCVSARGGELDTNALTFYDIYTVSDRPGNLIVGLDSTLIPGYVWWDGSTIIDGAITHPRVAARYSFLVSGDDLVMPDSRGEFWRIWDNAAGHDPDSASRTARAGDAATGDVPGSMQLSQFESHRHGRNIRNTSSNRAGGSGATGHSGTTTAYTTYEGGNETRGRNIYITAQMRLA